jgi:hypothetical protein
MGADSDGGQAKGGASGKGGDKGDGNGAGKKTKSTSSQTARKCLIKLHMCRFNLLTHFWINPRFGLARGLAQQS